MAKNISTEKAVSQNGLLYFWTQLKAKLAGKVDKVDGKGLSTNDFTDDLKTKLDGIEAGANKTVVEDVLTSTSKTNALSAAQGKALNDRIDNVVDSMGELGYGDMMKATYDADNDGKIDHALLADTATQADNATKAADADKFGGQLPTYYAKAADLPTKVSELENDSAYITKAAIPTQVSKFENDAGYLTEHQDISSKLDKTGDGSNVTSTFTPASERANIATGEKLSTIFGKIAKYFADLKTVAFTGSYNDLTNKPEIPTVTNDLTDALKANYDAAYTHSQAAHAPSDAEKNIVVGVQVNGTDVAPDSTSRKVNITVPTAVSQLSDAAEYAKKSDLTNVYKYKGTVANFAALPAEGLTAGDVYDCEDTDMNYGWNGEAWDPMGTTFSIEYVTNEEIDTILAS